MSEAKPTDIEFWLKAIRMEYETARLRHRPMASRHEGYAVILEELDELWDEVKKKHPGSLELSREAVQVAAMALAFLIEVA